VFLFVFSFKLRFLLFLVSCGPGNAVGPLCVVSVYVQDVTFKQSDF